MVNGHLTFYHAFISGVGLRVITVADNNLRSSSHGKLCSYSSGAAIIKSLWIKWLCGIWDLRAEFNSTKPSLTLIVKYFH